jgi:GTP-binding protein
MFVDTVTLTLAAGKGGNGVVAWRREKYIPKGGPVGGNGGRGGSIIFETDVQIHSLEAFRNARKICAENGHAGGGNLQQGRTGKDLTLKIPPGTIIKDTKTGEILKDFTVSGERWALCKGGQGGKGNHCFKSPTHQAPNICTPGTEGEVKDIELELKLIADVGFIGMPNAGKSTLMSEITHVPVKIAAYPFTTLFPNLGYVQYEDDFSRVLIADIPGIIKGAHQNRGLGIAFLKHIERTSVLVFVIDASGIEERDPWEDFKVLRDELGAYKEEMLDKPFVVALNKADVEESELYIESFQKYYPYPKNTLFPISAKNGDGLAQLLEAIRPLAQASGKRF